MSSDIVIRPERADHPQAVAALGRLDAYLASLYEPEANHLLSVQELLAPDVTFFAAWDGGSLVGTAAARRRTGDFDGEHRTYGEVKRMYVDPSCRGRGVGRRLVEVVESTLRGQGLAVAMLETGAAQREAVRLYERCGYTRRGPFGGYPDNGLSLFMQKRLVR